MRLDRIKLTIIKPEEIKMLSTVGSKEVHLLPSFTREQVYEWSHVTLGVACERTITNQWQ